MKIRPDFRVGPFRVTGAPLASWLIVLVALAVAACCVAGMVQELTNH